MIFMQMYALLFALSIIGSTGMQAMTPKQVSLSYALTSYTQVTCKFNWGAEKKGKAASSKTF